MSELASAGLASLLGACGTTPSGARPGAKGGKPVAHGGSDDGVAPPMRSGSDLQVGVPAHSHSGYTSLGASARGVPPPNSAPAASTASQAGEPPYGMSPAVTAPQQRGPPVDGGGASRDSIHGSAEQQHHHQPGDDTPEQHGYQPQVPAAKPLAEDARNALQSAVDWLQASNNRLKQSLQDAEERAVRAESDAVGARRAAEAAQSRLDGAIAEARAAGAREARAGKVASDSEEMLKLRSDLRQAYVDKAAAAKEAKARGEDVLNLRAKLQELGVEVTALKEQAARYRGVRDPGAAAAASTVNTAAEVAAATSSLHRTIEQLKAELNAAHNARAVVLGDLEKMRAACDDVAQAAQEDLAAAAARELQLCQRIEALAKADSDLSASDLRQRLRDMQALLTEREAQEARMGAALGGQGGQKSVQAAAQPPGSASPPQAPPSVPPPPGGSGLSLQLVAELEALRQEVVRLSHGAARERDGRKKAEDALRAAGLLGAPDAAATSPPVKATPGMGWAQAQRAAGADSEGGATVVVMAQPKPPADDAPAPVAVPPPQPPPPPPPPAVEAAPVLPPPVVKAPPEEEPPAAAAPSSNELPPAPAPGWVSGRPTRSSSVSAGATPSEPHVLVKRRPNPLMSGPSAVGTGAALSAIARKDEEAYTARSVVSYGDDASLVLERTEDRPMPSRYNADDGLREPRQQAPAAATSVPSMLAQLASEMRRSAEASDGKAAVRGGSAPGRPASVRSVPPPPTHAPQQQQEQQQEQPAVPPVPSVGDPSLADELAQLMASLGSLQATMATPPTSAYE